MITEQTTALLKKCLKAAEVARGLLEQEARAGDESAFRMLHQHAVDWNESVDTVRQFNFPVVEAAAPTLAHWPGNLALHGAALDAAAVVMRQIQLASSRHDYAVSGPPQGIKRVRLDSPAQTISIDIHDWLQRARRMVHTEKIDPLVKAAIELPLLTSEGIRRKWFDCGWAWFTALHSGDVLQDKNARRIAGRNRKGRNSSPGYVKDQVYKASKWWLDPVRR